MQSLGARQASIDHHLEIARRCLALSASQRSLFGDDMDTLGLDPLQSHDIVVVQPQLGSRIAAKIIHFQNLIANLTPIPATTETDQHSVFDRFRASVETLWSDRREYGARDQMSTQARRLVQQVHADLPSRRSLEFSSTSTTRHRRAGSSRI